MGNPVGAAVEDHPWMKGLFAYQELKNMPQPWIGGPRQTVYAGPTVRTYRIAGTANPTGLWVIANGDEVHPIAVPTYGNAQVVAGNKIEIQLSSENRNFISVGMWIDSPPHDYRACRGAITHHLGGQGDHFVVHNGALKVFRFTSLAWPTGVWVTTGEGLDLPVPSDPTAIEVGGTYIEVINRGPRDMDICWVDVT